MDLSKFPFIPNAACDYILFTIQTTYIPSVI